MKPTLILKNSIFILCISFSAVYVSPLYAQLNNGEEKCKDGAGQDPIQKLAKNVKNASKEYIFDPDDLNQLGKGAVEEVEMYFYDKSPEETEQKLFEIGLDFYKVSADQFKSTRDRKDLARAMKNELILRTFHTNLRLAYPGKILKKPDWTWNNVGGIYARLQVLYCSATEYVALFHSPLPQQGYSGRYKFMDVYDIMLTGKMYSHSAPAKAALPIPYRAGDISLLKKKESRFYNMSKGASMIDYGRGFIPPALGQGVIYPWMSVNHDSEALKIQLRDCTKSFFQTKINSLKSWIKEHKPKLKKKE